TESHSDSSCAANRHKPTTEITADFTTVEDTTVEDTTVEDTTVEVTTVEVTTVEDTTVEVTTVEVTTVEVTTVEVTTVEVTTVEDTTVEDTTVEDTTVEDTTVEDTTVEDTTVEDTTVEDTTVEVTAFQHTCVKMSEEIYENCDGFSGKKINKIETMDINDQIYNNERPIMPCKKDGDQHSVSCQWWKRYSGAAAVCLGLLCVLLLAGIIGLFLYREFDMFSRKHSSSSVV
uniref:Uncharacterized protein n=1 Tax=Oncorhynchus kisutch TaxID=8019 RepID=A0A8C7I142_ONCKI